MFAQKRARPTAGDVVGGKYRVERPLGEGGMGYVLAARHVELGQRVALKLLREERAADEEVVERFLREARAAAQLGSEHVAHVSDVGRLPSGAPFFVMEYLEGCDAAALAAEGPLAVPDAVGLVVQACHGLAEAHRAGIVHRDVKPHNLFVTRRRDGTPCVKVLDFGIARHQVGHGKLTQTATVIGSPPYMSPEQMTASPVDARSDVWSLGATLYELLAGRCPFPGGSVAEIYARVLAGPPEDLSSLRPDVPEALAAVVARCLARAPAERWPDAATLAEALAPFAPRSLLASADLTARVERIGATTRVLTPVTPRRRGRAWIAVAIAAVSALVVVAAAIAWRAWAKGDAPAPPSPTMTVAPSVAPPPSATADTTTSLAPLRTPTVSATDLPSARPTARPTVTTRPTASAPPRASVDPFGQRTW